MKKTAVGIFFPQTLCVFLLLFSCGTDGGAVLDISAREAARRLKKGDIDFIMEAKPENMQELAKISPSAPYYAGLLVKRYEDAPKTRSVGLFCAALKSPVSRVREEASLELIRLMAEGWDFSESVSQAIRAAQAGKQTLQIPAALEAVALYRAGRYNEVAEGFNGAPLSDETESSISSAVASGAVTGGSEYGAPALLQWERAARLLSSIRANAATDAATADTFAFLTDSSGMSDARTWMYNEIDKWRRTDDALPLPPPLDETGLHALKGRVETARRDYSAGLSAFRRVIERERTLFFKNPALIVDLGRCFQYTGTGKEGAALFQQWEGELRELARTKKEHADTADARYNLLLFAGRMERQRENWKEAVALFTRALAFAPDAIQEDACIWYILDTAFQEDALLAVPLLRVYAKRWHDGSYFSDVLGKLCQYFTAQHNWTKLLEIFSVINPRNGEMYADEGTVAKYAYIIARTLSEDYIPAAEAAAFTGREGLPSVFFRIAFEAENASFYYRVMSARHIGEHVIIPASESGDNIAEKLEKLKDQRHEAAFLAGFFEYGVGNFAYPYMRNAEESLALEESRVLAYALSESGRYYDMIRFMNGYMQKEDYETDFFDMTLFYPRPFYAIVRRYAGETGVHEPTLFGLIRTESSFRADVVSSAGAVGLAQIMEATGQETAERIQRDGGPDYLSTGLDLTNPEINVHIGAYYLASLEARTNSAMLALLGYNGGPNRIRRLRGEETVLPDDLFVETIYITETREYGKRVASASAVYGYLYYGEAMEDILADIMDM